MSPHIAWLLLTVALIATNCSTHARLDSAQTKLSGQNKALKQQNEDAETQLEAERERVATLQRALKIAAEMQRKKDEENTLATLAESEKLRLATAPTGRLRDPHARPDTCGKSGGGGEGKAGADPGQGATGEPQTGGLLSAPLTAVLGTTQLEADTINNAYASCKARLLSDRGLPPSPIDTE